MENFMKTRAQKNEPEKERLRIMYKHEAKILNGKTTASVTANAEKKHTNFRKLNKLFSFSFFARSFELFSSFSLVFGESQAQRNKTIAILPRQKTHTHTFLYKTEKNSLGG